MLLSCHRPRDTTSADHPYPAPWGSSHPAHGPGPHFSPPDPSVPAETMSQQCWSSAPHTPALPGHGSHRSRPIHGPTSHPVPIPREVTHGLDSWLNLAMVSGSVPLPRCSTVGLGPCNQVGTISELAASI